MRPGDSWGVPATGDAEVSGAGGDGELASLAGEHRGQLVRFVPDDGCDFPRAIGLTARSTGSWEVTVDLLVVGDGGRDDRLGVNLLTVGTRPDRLRRWTRPVACTVAVDGTPLHDGPATTVVVANGQYLAGYDVVPRGHPGDGRLEVQVYALAAGERRAIRARLAGGDSSAASADPDGERPGSRDPARAARPGRARRGPAARSVHLGCPGRPRCPAPAGLRARAGPGSPDPPEGIGTIDLPSVSRDRAMHYVAERFTPQEEATLRPYFTNLDGPVFALVNLPEVVKGALFAALLAQLEEPAAAVPRRVRRRPRPHGRPHGRRDDRPEAGGGALRPRVLRVRR